MTTIKVTLVNYKLKNSQHVRKGVEILNRNSNTITLIDCKTLLPIDSTKLEYRITLEISYGNIFFRY